MDSMRIGWIVNLLLLVGVIGLAAYALWGRKGGDPPGHAIAAIEARRWNYFLAGGRYVSIHPTRSDAETTEAYGEARYRAVGAATVEATVTDASESAFLPAVYRVADVRVVEGAARPVTATGDGSAARRLLRPGRVGRSPERLRCAAGARSRRAPGRPSARHRPAAARS